MYDTKIYSRKIVDLIDELILEGNYRCYEDLPEFNKDELSWLGIRSLESPYEILTESTDEFLNEVMLMVSGYAKINHAETAHDIARALTTRTNRFFETQFSELFNERYNQIACELKYEAGLRPIVDHVNGEVRWVKS